MRTQLKQDLQGFLFLLEARIDRDVLTLEEILRAPKVEFCFEPQHSSCYIILYKQELVYRQRIAAPLYSYAEK